MSKNAFPTIAVWFSCGAASAVAAYETIRQYGDTHNIRIVNSPIKEEDEDNQRFLKDVELWLNHPIEFAYSSRYPSQSAKDVWEDRQYMGNTQGAPCTIELKKVARQDWEKINAVDYHVLGFVAEEVNRHKRFILTERDNVIPVLIDAGISKKNCYEIIIEAGIKLPRVYDQGYPNANCFTKDTRFLTRNGVKSLGECLGENVKVRSLGKGNPWRDATVEYFGEQQTVDLIIKRNNVEKTIRTTHNHRWLTGTRKHSLEKTTEQLSIGDKLACAHFNIHSRIIPSPWGIAHGITFGDGTVSGSSKGGCARLTLCGDKDRELLQYFPLSPTKEVVDVGVQVYGLPNNWKTVPSFDMDDSYLFGWLAGYFAADGCASDSGDYFISSARLDHLQAARDVAIRLGISTGDIRQTKRDGFNTGNITTLYSLPLVGYTLKENFFLIKHHKERFCNSNPRQPHPWFVKDIKPTGLIEDVYCVVEPITETFVLENNILTKNCIGCIKATSRTYWNHVREKHPDVFWDRAEQSRRLGAKLTRMPLKDFPYAYKDDYGYWWHTKTGECFTKEVHNENGDVIDLKTPYRIRIFLDELPPDSKGWAIKSMDVECGVFCEEKPNNDDE